MLQINKETSGNGLVYKLEGRLDTITSPDLEQELKASMEGIESLELNLDKLDYISSAGLRVLLSAHKVMSKQGSMKVTHVNSTISEIFEVTGFSDILVIE